MSDVSNAYSTLDAQPEAADLIACMRQTAALSGVRDLRGWTRPWLRIPRGQAVLDVGCGLADVLIDLAGAHPLRTVGVDVSASMLEQAAADARAAGADVELCQADAGALPFGDATFAAVRCERTLQWVGDPAAALAEIVRVLRPGGAAVLIDTDWRAATLDLGDPDLEELFTRLMVARRGSDIGGRLRRLAADAGLQDLRVRAAASVIGWDPDEQDTPPALPPPAMLARGLHELCGLSLPEADARVADLVAAARRGHFQMAITLLAVVGVRPGAPLGAAEVR